MRNSLFIFLVFCLPNLHLFADTYVWEDYDDFSDFSLDSSKWISFNSYFSGNEPTETGGYINLSGLTSLNNEKNTFLIVKNLEGIIGVEADIWLPSDAPNDTGVMIGIADGGSPVGYLDLWGNGDDSKLYVYLENSVSGESIDFNINAELGITYRVGIIKENERSALFLNGEKVAEVVTWQSENLNILFRGVNDAGSPYTAYLDNVRVLRRSTTTSLDGSTYSLSSSDGVSETLVFANGTFTSTFTDPEEGEIVTTDQSYILDQVSEDEFRIILGDGDTMEFNTATNSGKLTDYDSSGQIDTSGTWEFTFETTSTPSQSYAPSSIAGRMITYTGNGETETASFSADGIVTDGEDWTYYEYEKTSDNVGVVTYTFANETNPAPEVETLTFTSSSGGTYDWIEYSDSAKSTPIDQGSGQFTISASSETTSINVTPLAFGAFRDRVYLQGENGPVEIDGASEINFDLQLVGKPGVTTATLTLDNVSYDLTNLEAPAGFRTNYGYSNYDNEIFDVESSSDSDWSSYINGKTFDFDLTIEGSSYSYSHNLPSVSSLPAAPNISLANILEWEKDSEGYDSAKVKEQDFYEFSWDSFSSAGDNDYIIVHLQELVGDDEIEVISETVLASDSTSFSVNGSNIEIGKTYIFYVEWVKVTEQSNPSGFSYVAGTDTSLPLLQTSAESITALQFALEASTVAISDPNGQPVVVQVGDDYQWNDTLDGVMLWGVWQDDDTNEWVIATVNYIGGRQKGAKGSYSSLPNELDVDHPYIVDGDTIDVTETNGHQYYQVTSVENGIIYAVDGDGAPLTDPSWWFVTKASAEEFYHSKINYAPASLVGYTLTFDENETSPGSSSYGKSLKYFMEDMVFGLEEGQLEGVTYSYHVAESIPSTQAVIVFQHGENSTTTFEVTFSSHTQASGTWTEQDGTDQITGTIALEVATVDIAPTSLAGLTYLNEMNDFLSFFENDLGTFYSENESNFSNSEVSNITYSWEKLGPNIGVLTTSLDETTYLFFESPPEGFGVESTFLGSYVWMEEPGGESEFGIFTISHIDQGLAPLDLAGENLVLGALSTVFFEDGVVHITEGGETIAGSYAFTRYGEDILILSIYGEDSATPKVYKLDFKSEGTGDFSGSTSGSFKYTKNWAMKGWVWHDKFPWSFSNNQGDWLYQVLFLNDTNETNLAYYEAWSKEWKILDELDYGGETNLSASDSFAWGAYDDFNTSALDTSRWDVAWWDGGTSPTVDQANNRVVFNKGTTYEAKLSALMNETNSAAESEYGRGNESNTGRAPSTIADLVATVASIQTVPEEENYGMEEVYFDDVFRYRWDSDDQKEVEEPYIYSRTSPDTATISIEQADGPLTLELDFETDTSGTGTWSDIEGGETYSGTLTFDLLYSPHSLLEFKESDDVQGIEIELMIPNDAPDKTCIGLFAVDYEQMFNAGSDEEEEGAIKFDLDLCYFNNSLKMEFNYKDLSTNEEVSLYRDAALGDYQKVAFHYGEDQLSFYHNEELVVTIDYVRGFEEFSIRAQNETNTDFSAYLRNVRVLKQKPYPQGWMWMHYYPWAYSYDSGNWLYFRTAKDADGEPSMIYWDESSEEWDLYFPVLSSSQNDEKETADKLLEQHE